MLKELEKIHKRSQEIYKDYPAKRASLEAQLKAALEDLSAAKAEQDAADDLTRYDAAAEAVKRAELRAKFAEKALNKLDGAPRMTEQEYMATVGTCQGIVADATEEYRKNLIECFVNSVYVYDDKLIVTYNVLQKEKAELFSIEYALNSSALILSGGGEGN